MKEQKEMLKYESKKRLNQKNNIFIREKVKREKNEGYFLKRRKK